MGKHPEKILVVKAEYVANRVPEGYTGEYNLLVDMLRRGVVELQVRDEVEHDPAWKQIIPYVVFLSHAPVSLFTYVRSRAGHEERLHDLLSIGVGGHVEESDLPRINYTTYCGAVRREIEEEIEVVQEQHATTAGAILSGVIAPLPIGLINDNSNDVGQCHLGILHLSSAPGRCIRAKEDHLADARWMDGAELRANLDRFETWSQIALRDFLLPGVIKG